LLLRRVQEVAERLFFYARIGMVDKGKLNALLQGYIENGLRDWAENKAELKAQKFDLSETTAERYLTGNETNIAEQYRSIALGAGRSYFGSEKKEFIRTHARMLLEDNGLDVQGEDFDRFADMFAKVYVKTQEELANREEGRHSYDYRQFVQGMFEEDQPIRMKPAVDEVLALKRRAGLTDGTMKAYGSMSEIILGFYGEDYEVKKLNNKELIRFIEVQQAKGVKNTTINQRKRFIQEVVKQASSDHGFVMPTFNVKLKDDKSNVLPYTADELNQMFVVLNDRKIYEWAYWAMLVSLLSGLRQSEVVSLDVADLRLYEGVWYFDVTAAKSEAGIRRVPVSKLLVQLGFMDFLKKRQMSKEPHLFMCHLPKSKNYPIGGYVQVPSTKYGDFFSNSVREKLMLQLEEGQKKDHHSLRHNFSDSLKQGRVSAEYRDELCGHAGKVGSMRAIYDEKFGVLILAEELQKAKWECDFSLLKTWRA